MKKNGLRLKLIVTLLGGELHLNGQREEEEGGHSGEGQYGT
jgi:hypothetical protein